MEWHEIAGVYSTQRGAGCDWNHIGKQLSDLLWRRRLGGCRAGVPPAPRGQDALATAGKMPAPLQLSGLVADSAISCGSALRPDPPSAAWRLGTAIFLSRPQTEISCWRARKTLFVIPVTALRLKSGCNSS